MKSFEGLSLTPYLCPAGVWTIGYGHTAGVKKTTPVITPLQAETILVDDLDKVGEAVSKLVKVPLGDNQFGALVSFAFNVGKGALASSTLLKKLNAGDYDAVPAQLSRWNKATVRGKLVELPGLTRRRVAEGALWLQDADRLPPLSMPQAVTSPLEDLVNQLNQGATS